MAPTEETTTTDGANVAAPPPPPTPEESERAGRTADVRRAHGPDVEPVHTEACRLLPNRNHLLDVLPRQGIVAELGVADGDFSHEILTRMKPRELHLIDVWQSTRYAGGLANVEERFRREIVSRRVVIRRGYSQDVLAEYPDMTFDFIYIDTSHAYDHTLTELRVAEAKVNATGLIGGHDFSPGNVVTPVVYGVIQAVNLFCRERNWRYKYLTVDTGGSFSFCLERIPARR